MVVLLVFKSFLVVVHRGVCGILVDFNVVIGAGLAHLVTLLGFVLVRGLRGLLDSLFCSLMLS